MHSNSSPLARLADQIRRNSDRNHFHDFPHLYLPPDADLHQPSTSPDEQVESHLPHLAQDSLTNYQMWQQQEEQYHHNEQRVGLIEHQESDQHEIESHLTQDNLTDYQMWLQQEEAEVHCSNFTEQQVESQLPHLAKDNLTDFQMWQEHCSNLTELLNRPFYQQNVEQRVGLVEQQESEHEVESHLPHLAQDNLTSESQMWQQQEKEPATDIRHPSNLFLGDAEPTAIGPMTYHDPKPDLFVASPPFIPGSTCAAMATYLPEPPESDIQSLLNKLPERGKLLQAVMNAGPILQTLFLTCPLPQRNNPSSLLDLAKIPRISQSSTPNSLPVCSMAHYMPNPHRPTATLDPMQVNTPVSSYPRSLNPRTRINEPSSPAFNSSLQSEPIIVSSFVDLMGTPMLNSEECPPKFAKKH